MRKKKGIRKFNQSDRRRNNCQQRPLKYENMDLAVGLLIVVSELLNISHFSFSIAIFSLRNKCFHGDLTSLEISFPFFSFAAFSSVIVWWQLRKTSVHVWDQKTMPCRTDRSDICRYVVIVGKNMIIKI